jgi:signal peptidase I
VTDSKADKKPNRPWRDNLEAVAMAIIMAVLLKYFVVEAYKIPTGSMQPTLMGLEYADHTGEIKDRILVDKASYHFRAPARFEVAVFRYPLDRSKNFIKRIVGMGPEDMKVLYGDVFTRPDSSEPWKTLRRPRPIQMETRKRLAKEWGVHNRSKGVTVEGNNIHAPGEGSARFPKGTGAIMDDYKDGYPGQMAEKLAAKHKGSGSHPVGDLYLEGSVNAQAACTSVEFEFHEGGRSYFFVLPGPESGPDARARIRSIDRTGRRPAADAVAEDEWRLSAGESVDFCVQNLDDLLELRIDDEVLLSLEIEYATDQASAVFLHTRGGGADFEELEVYRDIYYTNEKVSVEYWSIPEDHYMMLGDNTQDSADSREWSLVVYPDETGEGVLRGQRRRKENPITVSGGPDGEVTFLRDEYGELHHFLSSSRPQQTPEMAPFVPRNLVTGRALLVFWPLVPSLDVYRLQWIR